MSNELEGLNDPDFARQILNDALSSNADAVELMVDDFKDYGLDQWLDAITNLGIKRKKILKALDSLG